MIEMREDKDGIFRADGPDRPLPYGLPDDPQEPFVAIVAPNVDRSPRCHSIAGRSPAGGPAVA